jgi:alkyl hydroperoxide reductase subunit AhpC
MRRSIIVIPKGLGLVVARSTRNTLPAVVTVRFPPLLSGDHDNTVMRLCDAVSQAWAVVARRVLVVVDHVILRAAASQEEGMGRPCTCQGLR